MKNQILAFLSVIVFLFSSNVFAQRNVSEWNLDASKVAISGYDPVAYFPEGGGLAKIGQAELELQHEGVLYRFSSQENLQLFLSNPEKYEATYGGWCATAMAMGQKLVINPERFVVTGNRLFLFSFLNGNDARMMWQQDSAKLERRADFNWKKVSGEEIRR
ncbi:MAG: YHS domain protein [Bdellovibrio sp. CG12_big_fil_rev_8_21_14_0_65_39_13]|nr:MAG: YHS domain protein [Bdellovibrio sp. CG22_combo_CG10-13_8_21_14_all_39_27]PIQ58555.1 MAG: YHS domain protein [Bdellovibrio sp. CG12_big_fil_rev_8_21_14_0_65_39_13]PIR32462.1 MAG: YHS domain protein [Bdellovibrio sp. CG11_big_fil_rev_8_21_14_0_20_39_38]